MMNQWIVMMLMNFSFTMVVFAVFFMLLNWVATRGRVSCYEIIFRWLALFCLGFTGIYAFIFHAYYPAMAAATIGWLNSPFQFEVAVANLAFGVMGILSFRASYGFRLATVIGNAIWLWGDATGHIYQMIAFQNYTIGNAGTWFWTDVLIPLLLAISITKMRPVR